MNRSYSKIRHIQESNMLLERRLLEYDIYDNDKPTIEEILGQVSPEIQSINQETGTNLDFSTQENAEVSVNNEMDKNEICSIGDNSDNFIRTKFGEKIKGMFPDKFEEVIGIVSKGLNDFIDFLTNLKMSNPKELLNSLRLAIKTAKEKTVIPKQGETGVVSEEILKEFFGTSMALVSIGAFTMPALVLTIISVVLVTFIGLWLIKTLLCGFNIKITKIKNCRVRSFELGQCK